MLFLSSCTYESSRAVSCGNERAEGLPGSKFIELTTGSRLTLLIYSSLANLVRGALGQMKSTYSGVPAGNVAYLASLCLIVTRIVTTQQKQLRVSTGGKDTQGNGRVLDRKTTQQEDQNVTTLDSIVGVGLQILIVRDLTPICIG